jgi:hypothetical protein
VAYQQVVPYGDNVGALEASLGEIPTQKVFALVPPGADAGVLGRVSAFLAGKGIPFEVVEAPSESADSFFLALDRLKSKEGVIAPIVNVSVGNQLYSYIMLCAAMATGVAALGVFDDEVVFLPVSCSITHGK